MVGTFHGTDLFLFYNQFINRTLGDVMHTVFVTVIAGAAVFGQINNLNRFNVISAVEQAITTEEWKKEDGRYIPRAYNFLKKEIWTQYQL